MKSFFKHCWWAVRYGDWDCGCEFYEGKPMFSVCHIYYDGNWVAFHLGPLWVEVHY